MTRIFTASLLLLTLSSCHFFGGRRIKGDGNVVVQTRTVGNFSSVDVGGATDVYVTQDSSYSVKVEIDNNLQQFMEVYVDGQTLHIHQENNTSLQPSRDVKVYVSAPMFRRLEASGASSILGQNKLSSADPIDLDLSGASDATIDLRAPKVSVGLSGACSANLKGETKDLKVNGSGSTSIRAFELLSETADIDLSGAGSAEVYASVKLNAEASGATDVRYKGNASVNSSVSGAGSVKKVD